MAPIREMLLESGITEQQWRVLRVLSEFGPQDATEVSERACLLMPSLTRIIATLSERGLVIRIKDENDRRRQTLTISREGQQIIEDNRHQAASIAARFKSTLGAKRYETLLDILGALDDFD